MASHQPMPVRRASSHEVRTPSHILRFSEDALGRHVFRPDIRRNSSSVRNVLGRDPRVRNAQALLAEQVVDNARRHALELTAPKATSKHLAVVAATDCRG